MKNRQKSSDEPVYTGGCLCGEITYKTEEKPIFPHLCSCDMCKKWSGAPTVAWVEFPAESFIWDGKGGEPSLFRSSEKTSRCFCQSCGSTLGAIDDGYENISITIASLNNPNLIAPVVQHSYKNKAPSWWKVEVVEPKKRVKKKPRLENRENKKVVSKDITLFNQPHEAILPTKIKQNPKTTVKNKSHESFKV